MIDESVQKRTLRGRLSRSCSILYKDGARRETKPRKGQKRLSLKRGIANVSFTSRRSSQEDKLPIFRMGIQRGGGETCHGKPFLLEELRER